LGHNHKLQLQETPDGIKDPGQPKNARQVQFHRKDAMPKYGKKASEKVERAMHERKHGTLKSGRSGKKVTSRKQAIAIGLSEARKAGAKVPKPGKSK
jgi:Family of unknown function (DUF6496)